MLIMIYLLLLFLFPHQTLAANETTVEPAEIDFYLTIQSIYKTFYPDSQSLLFCHPTEKDAENIKFYREIDTGQGIDFPNNTVAVYYPAPKNFLALTLQPSKENNRFGVYMCEQYIDNETGIYVTALKISSNAEIVAEENYIRAYINESIVLNVTKKSLFDLPLIWSHDGNERTEWENFTEVTIPRASYNDSGIFEIFFEGHRHLGLHALIKVTVIVCPPHKWGDECDNDCPPCYNGGICHPDVGICLCPHGFHGLNCEKACPMGMFGKNCEKFCDYGQMQDPDDACGAYTFCLPDPLGCMCGSGFHGQECFLDCDQAIYGASCLQKCHCKDDEECNAITGHCPNGCKSGWVGESCQILAKNAEEYRNLSGLAFECPHGSYGFPECDQFCHCSPGNTCDSESGICPLGCAPEWSGNTCSECGPGLFGKNCQGICHCSAGNDACNSTTGFCDGGCAPGYTGLSCQSECPVYSYGQNCSLNCSCLNNGRCDHVKGTCECIGKWRGKVCDEFIPEIIYINNITMKTGIDNSISCIVNGKPLPDVQIWSPDFLEINTTVNPLNDSFQETVANLKLDNPQNLTMYCNASNIHGQMEEIFTVIAFECPFNTYGLNCEQNCSCMNSGRCDQNNGTCECFGKWQGTTCEEFAPMIISTNSMEFKTGIEENITCAVAGRPIPDIYFWSSDFQGLNSTITQINNSVQEAVIKLILDNPKNITVNCTANNTHGKIEQIFTITVFECPSNTYGPNCSSNCSCMNNAYCNHINGSCDCIDKWQGSKCDEFAPEIITADDVEIRVGIEENVTCIVAGKPLPDIRIWTIDLPGINAVVKSVNESVQEAVINFKLDQAKNLTMNCTGSNKHGNTEQIFMVYATECPLGTYGWNCSFNCSCMNGGLCNSINGSCTCKGKWKGKTCEDFQPQIVNLDDNTAKIGSKINITCIAIGKPLPDIKLWSSDLPGLIMDIKQLNDSMREAVVSVSSNVLQNLTINCTANNIHGNTEEVFIVVITDDHKDISDQQNCLLNCSCKNNGSCNCLNKTCECFGQWKGKTCEEFAPEILNSKYTEIQTEQKINASCVVIGNPPPHIQFWIPDIPEVNSTIKLINDSVQEAILNFNLDQTRNVTVNCTADNIHGRAEENFQVNVLNDHLQLYNQNCSFNCTYMNKVHYDCINNTCNCTEKWLGNTCEEFAPYIVHTNYTELKTGMSVNISCIVVGNPLPDIQIWSKDVPELNTVKIIQVNNSIVEAVVTLNPDVPLNVTVTCTASNIHGKIEENLHVIVDDCPLQKSGPNCSVKCLCMNNGYCNRIDGSCECLGSWRGTTCEEFAPKIIRANDIEINTGIKKKISCVAEGKPLPQIKIWSADYPAIIPTVKKLSDSVQEAVVDFSLGASRTLIMTCTSQNIHGKVERNFSVVVIEPPYLSSPPNVNSMTHEEINLSWKHWQFGKDGGGKANDSIEYQISIRYRGADWIPVNKWNTTTRDTVTTPKPDIYIDIGVRCRRVGNGGEGKIKKYTTTNIPCKFPDSSEVFPKNFHEEDITTNQVDLTWEKPEDLHFNCRIERYIFKLWVKFNKTLIKNFGLPFGAVSHSERGLKPNTEYLIELSVIARSKVIGTPANISILTKSLVMDAVVNLNFSFSSAPNEIEVLWEPPIVNAKDLDKYKVQIVLLQQKLCLEPSNNVSEIEVFGTKAQLKDLKPYSIYDIGVQPQSASGYGKLINITVNTREDVPSSPPNNVRVSRITNNSIEYAWDSVPCDQANGKISQYEYGIKKPKTKIQKRSISSWYFPPKKTNDTEVTIQNLEPHNEYEFQVRALTAAGEGVWSEPLLQRTAEYFPSKPSLQVVSFASRNVTVEIQPPDSVNGALLKYRLDYTSLDTNNTLLINSGDEIKKIKYTIKGLFPATKYSLQIAAKTNAGWGNKSEKIFVLTEEEVPSAPLDLKLIATTETILEIQWEKPLHSNGLILGYKIECNLMSSLTTNATSNIKKELEVQNTTVLVLDELIPGSEYKVKVVAFNKKGNGAPTVQVFKTLKSPDFSSNFEIIYVDNKNLILTVKILPDVSLAMLIKTYEIIVEESVKNNEVIDPDKCTDYDSAVKDNLFFYIAAEIPAENVTEEGYIFHVGDNMTYGRYLNNELKNTTYKIYVRTVGKKQGVFSSLSSSKEIDFKRSTDTQVSGQPVKSEDVCFILGMQCLWFLIIIICLTVCLFVLLILIIVCTRRRKRRGSHKISQSYETHSTQTSISSSKRTSKKHSSSYPCSVAYSVSANDKDSENGKLVYETNPLLDAKLAALRNSKFKSRIISMKDAIPIQFLFEYIQTKATHHVYNFHEEFRQLFSGQTATWSVARKSENVKKNRYGNILPYDHTRVILKPLVHIPHSDYINASYIDGYDKRKAYIASQGPKENFFADFWRMIWQENTASIIMVTNLIENGRVKCDQYWPNDNNLYGDIHVTLFNAEKNINFIVRTFQLTKISTNEKREVKQYQILDWPDQQAPMYASSVLALRWRLRDENPLSSGPTVVHCSAGVGRTGTFIAIDALLQQAWEEEVVDVFGYVNKMRLQRINMVQTLEQYVFVYEALLEAVECGETKVLANRVAGYFQELCRDSEIEPSGLVEQYMKLEKISRKQNWQECSAALREVNVQKNRDLMVLPSDQARICLSSKLDDYINAVFCDGFKQNDQFLVTQTPLPHTIIEFWQMIYDYKSTVIVMLDSVSKNNDVLKCADYWPVEGSKLYGQFKVDVVTFQNKGPFIEQHMKILNNLEIDGEPQRIVQLQFTDWSSENPLPNSLSSLIMLLRQIEVWHNKLGGPITIHCMDGASHSGLFCIASILSEQLRSEKAVDVFQAVRHLRNQQPNAVTNLDQYKFCYELAVAFAQDID